MKKVLFSNLFLLLFISISSLSFTQTISPVGDDPWNAIVVTELNQCIEITIDPSIYSVTTSVEAPGCGGNTILSENPDVWLLVTVPDNGNLFVSPPNIYNSDPALAVYRFDPLTMSYTMLVCNDDAGPGLMPMVDLTGLVPGEILYLRYWLYHAWDVGSVLSCSSVCNNASLYFADSDGDGYGNANQDGFFLCQATSGYVLNSSDCNDQDSTSYPGSVEFCNNGIDEDCSGSDSVCVILGCTDTLASNFNPQANQNDGSCISALTCNITTPTTTLCAGQSATLTMNTTGGAGASSQLPANLQQGLVAYYPFNGNANDESGNGNNGVVNGATLTADRFGNFGTAYNFDGNDLVAINQAPQIQFGQNGNFTYSNWFIAPTEPFQINDFRFFAAYASTDVQNLSVYSGGFQFGINNPNHEILLELGSTSAELFFGTDGVESSSWHHFSVSVNRQVDLVRVYLDGQEIGSKSIPDSYNYTPCCNSKLLIGGERIFNPMHYFIGNIDDVLIYNRALSPSEIQQLYTAQSYAWSNNETTPTITVSPTTSTTYSCSVTQGNQTCTASVDITVNPVITNAVSATIVEGQSYILGTQTLTTAGTYTEVFTSAAGCDSTVILTLNVTSSCLPTYVPTNGLVGYWPFCGNANDESGNGNNLVNNGGLLTTDRNNQVQKAYNFSSGYASLTSSVFNTPSFSFSAWVNPSVISNGLGDVGGTYFDWQGYFVGVQNGVPHVRIHSTSTTVVKQVFSSQTITANNWSLIIATFDGVTLKIYVNGVNTGSLDVGNYIFQNRGAVAVGRSPWVLNDGPASFPGNVDDVAIYNRALNSTEIQQLYLGQVQQPLTCNITAPTTTLCAGQSATLTMNTTGGAGASSQLPANLQQGLVAYYPFNGNANDESGNGNNGTVNGATLTSDRFGNVGSAYNFNGLSNISTSLIPITGQQSRTISAFIKISQFPVSNGDSYCILNFGSNDSGCNQAGGNFGLDVFNESGMMYFRIDGTCSAIYSSYSGNDWHNITAVYNSQNGTSMNNIKLYLDGSFVSTIAYNGSQDLNTLQLSPLTIGMGNFVVPGHGMEFMNGLIDDIVIYNRALSPSEIQQLYTAQSYAWSTNATTPTITVSPTTNTTFSCTVTSGTQTCTASVDITVNPVVTNAISATIIQGQSYTLGAQTLTTAGTYTEVFTSAAGCDSTVTLTLAVEPLLSCNITTPTTTLCAGQSATLTMNTTGGAGASSQLPANLQQGLVAYYPFNGNANDESGNGNNGTVNGATLTADRFGSVNGAYAFNGLNSIINVNSILGNFGNSDFSISSWVSINSLNPEVKVIVGKRNAPGYGNFYEFGVKPLGYFYEFNASSPGDLSYTTGVGSISAGWELVSFVRQGSVVRIYQNGALLQEFINNTNHTFSNDAVFTIGGRYAGTGLAQIFDGNIDEVMVYNRALSPSEIQQLYTAQSYAWSTNATTPSITVSPTNNTTYNCTVTSGSQTCTASIDITVNPQQTYFADADGDGYGNPNEVVSNCNPPTGYVTDNTDCNDNNASVHTSTTETCNGLDDNCNGQIDEGLTQGSVTAIPVTTNVFPTCSGTGIKSANLNTGTNSAIIDGNGLDLWYSLTAQYNTLRAGLSAAFGDNEIRLYQVNNGCFQLIQTEHEVYTTTTQGTGNQVLISDELIPGQTYYVAVHNISGAMNTSAKMCFNHFVESTCDHYYSNYTGIYPNVCTSFKAQYKGNASNYIFNILSATQNNQNMNITPWTYATGSALSVVSRIGSIFPANMSTANKTYTLNVPVVYSIPDAAGNYTSITANGTSTCTVTMNPETTIALRSLDRCPNTKTTSSSVSIDRTICGALRYEWEFTQQLPTVQPAVTVLGGLNSSVLFLNNVPGMGLSKTYNVRVRPIHANGEVGSWGTVQCLKTGTAGMVLENHPGSAGAVQWANGGTEQWANNYSPLNDSRYTLYPNPTTTGRFTLTASNTSDEEVKDIKMMDITGKVVYKTQVVLNGNAVEIEFGNLASGVYVVMVGEERMRLVVQ